MRDTRGILPIAVESWSFVLVMPTSRMEVYPQLVTVSNDEAKRYFC